MNQRPFNPPSDVVQVRDFLSHMVRDHGQDRFLHIGDWLWQLHGTEDRLNLASQNIRIWTDGSDAILGFAWFNPPEHLEMQVNPTASPAGEIETEMIAWARTRMDGSENALFADAYERDERKTAVLTRLGFRETGEDRYNYFRQAFETGGNFPEVVSGTPVRAVAMPSDLEDRVAIHREVWHPSKVNAVSYGNVRAAPGFIPDLDLIAVAPSGEIAAYATVWYDPNNRIGEFEPVGSREAFRRQGYALAVMREGLRRLQTLGATEAFVFSSATNDASNGLYVRSGFQLEGQYRAYEQAG